MTPLTQRKSITGSEMHQDFEYTNIKQAIETGLLNLTQMARLMKVDRANLHRRIRQGNLTAMDIEKINKIISLLVWK